MRVNFVTYAYPPIKFPRSIQIAHLAKYISKYVDLTVFCGDFGTNLDKSLVSSVDHIKTYRVPSSRLTSKVWSARGDRLKDFFFPDQYFLWSRDLSRFLADKVGSSDIIITFGQPMTVHLAGLNLKKRRGMKWVAHFSDPWYSNPFNSKLSLGHLCSRHYERKVLRAADAVIYTSQETLELTKNRFGKVVMEKGRVLSHCFDPDYFGGQDSPVGGGRKVVRYLGNFYGSRQPFTFFQALEELAFEAREVLNSLKIEFYVENPVDLQNHISLLRLPEGLISIFKPVNYLESLELMRNSDLLMIIDAPTEKNVFFPSKLVDYLGSRRPIFGITPPGTSADVIKSLGYGVANPSKVAEIKTEFLNAIKNLDQRNSIAPQEVNGYSLEIVGRKFLGMLRAL